MQSIQNKIDKLIQQGNQAFSEENRVIEALIKYSRAYELYDYLDRKYNIQIHEVLVRIAICWDVLGNYILAYDNLCKALNIIPKIKVLTVYKTALEFSLNKNNEAFETLDMFNKICQHSKYIYLYYLFLIIFKYIGYESEPTINHEKQEKLLEEINKYFSKYGKSTVLLYMRSKIYSNLSCWAKTKNKIDLHHEYSKKREEDIKSALAIDKVDTNCLMAEGVTRSNLTKLFFMVLPEMDYYQPKVLVCYGNLFCGFKQFYLIFRFIKKIKKKKSFFTENKENNIDISKIKFDTDTSLHFFIRNKYFAQFNVSQFFLNPFKESKINPDVSSISLSQINCLTMKMNEKSIEDDVKLFENKGDNLNLTSKSNKSSSNFHLSNLKSNPMYKNFYEFVTIRKPKQSKNNNFEVQMNPNNNEKKQQKDSPDKNYKSENKDKKINPKQSRINQTKNSTSKNKEKNKK